jgi:hypothetical protein
MSQLNCGFVVTAIERVEESPKDGDLLLVSHRPRSISRWVGTQPLRRAPTRPLVDDSKNDEQNQCAQRRDR